MRRTLAIGQMSARRVCVLLSALGLLAVRSGDATPPVVFTQVKAGQGIGGVRPLWPKGRVTESRVVLLRPDGGAVVLTEGFAGACDPDVSFDATRVLFAGRRRASDRWGIYEAALDGSQPRQVVGLPEDCFDPAYLPDGRILFSRFIKGGRRPEAALFACQPDGSEPRRLTFHFGVDLGATLLKDGRALFTHWQYHERTRRWVPQLFTINSDGTGVAAVSGAQGIDGRQTPEGQIVFVALDGSSPDGGGTLAALSTRRVGPKGQLTERGTGRFLTPFPLQDGGLCVAHLPDRSGATYGLYGLASGEASPLYDDPLWHDVDPVAAVPRPLPMGHLSIMDSRKTTGVLYCLDTTFPGGGRPPVTLRVVTGPRRRVVGYAQVESDGSFAVEAPADAPLSLELLGGDGAPVRPASQWVWVRPNETRGCVGCHEARDIAPENRRPIALTKPPVPLRRQ